MAKVVLITAQSVRIRQHIEARELLVTGKLQFIRLIETLLLLPSTGDIHLFFIVYTMAHTARLRHQHPVLARELARRQEDRSIKALANFPKISRRAAA